MTLNELVVKIGYDKVVHFLSGSLISSIITIIALLQWSKVGISTFILPTVGIGIAFIISLIKELTDIKFDWKDIVATILGVIPTFIAVGLGVLFYYLNL